MKKIIYSMLAFALSVGVFTSCEDVPEPYANPNTAVGDGGSTTTGTYLSEAFQTDGLGKFTVKNVKGTEWKMYQTKYAVATGYDNATKTTTPSESYLVSPEFDLTASKEASMQFEYIYRYKGTGTVNRVLITSTYTGDPATTQWEDITGTLVEGQNWTTWTTWKNNIPAAYIGKNKVVVALHYACDAKSATWEVKNLVVKEGKVEVTTPSVPETPAGEAKGDGTEVNPYNAVNASTKAVALTATDTLKNVYVTGVVSAIKEVNTQYGNATYSISEDGKTTSTQFSIFRGAYLNGAKFTSVDQLKVGQKVVVLGNLINFKGTTPQMAQGGKLVSIDGEGTTTPVTPEKPSTANGITISGTTVTLTNATVAAGAEQITVNFSTLGFTDAQEMTTISLTDGTTITFDKNGETNGPKYYNAGTNLRVYKNNKVIFNGYKPIASIVMNCYAYNGTNFVGNATATLTTSGNTMTYTNVFNELSGGGIQLRMKTITITYAQ